MYLTKNCFKFTSTKLVVSLLILTTFMLTGCGAGGGNPEGKTGKLAPESILISTNKTKIIKSQATNFNAIATYRDLSTADITTKVTWSSSSPAATISDTGAATGVSPGDSNINASIDGITSNTVMLTVNPASLLGGSIQGNNLTLSTTVSTLAGSGEAGIFNATGTTAKFFYPNGVTTDGTNIFVADSNNHQIRKIVIATGVVTTLAGSGLQGAVDATTGSAASFNQPSGITTDGTNLYVSEWGNHKIRKIVIASGEVTTVAGLGVAGYLDATGAVARFAQPGGITTDGINLYVSDTGNSRIRKIVITSRVVTTIAGSGANSSVDGSGITATFSAPQGITTDGANLYVTDFYTSKIRKIVISGEVVTTIAGTGSSGSVDGIGTASSFSGPVGITTDGINLYVVDAYNQKIRKIVIDSGVVTSVAGGTRVIGAAEGIGTAASFSTPSGITTDGINLYIGDTFNNKIRKIQ